MTSENSAASRRPAVSFGDPEPPFFRAWAPRSSEHDLSDPSSTPISPSLLRQRRHLTKPSVLKLSIQQQLRQNLRTVTSGSGKHQDTMNRESIRYEAKRTRAGANLRMKASTRALVFKIQAVESGLEHRSSGSLSSGSMR